MAIFALAQFLRFLYFPDNIYFGFDQARDGYATKEILEGQMKLIGPPTTFEGLNHGVLYYYLYAPFYWLGGGDPAFVAAFLRVLNGLGVILIFAIAATLFNKYVGLISALLFALSFEQTQFALYLNHPSLAVISILTAFWGLSLLIFRQPPFGLIVALAGLGLSIQFEFLLVYLAVTFVSIIFTFRKIIPKLEARIKLLGAGVLFITLSSFIIAEVKFGFRSFNFLFQLLFGGLEKSLAKIFTLYFFEMGQVIKFNFTGETELKSVVALVLLISFLIFLKSKVRKQLTFLGLWFFSIIIIYFVGGGGDISTEVIQYHPNVGISLSLLIFVSFLLFSLWKKVGYLLPIVILITIFAVNFSLIRTINPQGSMAEINAQSFMLLSDEKKVLDYIYEESGQKEFAVKAITLPFYINTTWSYLFEWYGLKKYGYLPIWNGKNAAGFPGNLEVFDAQDKAPEQRYLIIEPIRGIPTYLIDDYLREESYFTDIEKQVKIGRFQVQVRYKK